MAKLPLAQLPELIKKLEQYNEEGERRSEITRAALTFALLTWVRTKELRFAKKHEFEDLDGSSPIWRIAPDRMKMHREHIVPMSMQAASLAKDMIACSQSDYVFPGQKRGVPLSENTMIYGLYRLDGLIPFSFRSLESLTLDQGDRRDEEAYSRVQAGGSAHCAEQRAVAAACGVRFRRRFVDVGHVGCAILAI